MVEVLDVKLAVDLLSLVGHDTTLKRVAGTGGGEFCGPCPLCGGEDRFRVQRAAPPGKKPEGSRWMCRVCSPRWSDAIGYIQKRDKLDFQQALEYLDGAYHLDAHERSAEPPPAPKEPESDVADPVRWEESSKVFVDESARLLYTDEGAKALDYLHRRGLDDYEIKYWCLGFSPKEDSGRPEAWGLNPGTRISIPRGIVIPCEDAAGLHYVKIRRAAGDPKYQILKGGHMWPFGARTCLRSTFGIIQIAFLFESEFDAMLAHQTQFDGIGYLALPAGQPIKTEYQPIFDTLEQVLVAYDSDDPGRKAAAELCRIPGFYQTKPLPTGKDLTEYYQSANSPESVLEWLMQQVGNLA